MQNIENTSRKNLVDKYKFVFIYKDCNFCVRVQFHTFHVNK